MALASVADVEAALGRVLTQDEDVTTLLEEASDLVVGYLRHTPNPVPNPVKRAVATMVVAVMTKPAVTMSDYSADGYNISREPATVRVGVESPTTSGPWLTMSLKRRISMYRRIGAVQMGSERELGS